MGCTGSTEKKKNSSANKNEQNKRSSHDSSNKKELQKMDSMGATERAFKAALLIQRWYRRYLARQEIRRRCSWSIFQSLEYAGEQDQIKLYEFFNDLIQHLATAKPEFADAINKSLKGRPSNLHDKDRQEQIVEDKEDRRLLSATNPSLVIVESSYNGPHITPPMTADHVTMLIDAFKEKKVLHAKYVLIILHEARKVLRTKPNINPASTAICQQITVCGDLHGKIDDLLTIFYKNGLPALDNPYVFNGDYVDRGSHSMEILMLLLTCVIVWPDSVFLNRGNHEDFSVNIRYGFVKEIMSKYGRNATKVAQATEEIYSWLPLATLIDNKVFVVHGGVGTDTDLSCIASLNRHMYPSILRPPPTTGDEQNEEAKEWKQIVDLLWSDPNPKRGCRHNSMRGGGCFFGPDVTRNFLKKHKLDRIIRSHECKPDGHEYTHQGKVLTIFSASNYYDVGSNRGAYVKLMGEKLEPHIVMFVSSKGLGNIQQRQGFMEQCALRDLKEHLYACKSLLEEEFVKRDPENTGKIALTDWCSAVEGVISLQLPWRLLCPKVAEFDEESNTVLYNTTFEEFKLTNQQMTNEGPSLMEALYRNKDTLETIFRVIDKDGSGKISMDEFSDACNLLGKHCGSNMSPDHISDLARSIDINKDGYIDFNEFLEAFRLVSRQLTNGSVERDGVT